MLGTKTYFTKMKVLSVVNMGINLKTTCRHTKIYQQGVNNFIAFAYENSAVGSKILCPYRKCVNSFWREGSEVREHLICDGFLKGYRTWTAHGSPWS